MVLDAVELPEEVYLGKSQNMLLFALKVQLLARHFINMDPT